MKQKSSLGAIILAAGRGKRINSKRVNKVVYPLANKPMILHEVFFLEKLGIAPIVVVVGFAKESVKNILKDNGVIFAEQKKRLGTGHAVSCALKVLPEGVKNVLVIQGDDSAFYRQSTKDTVQHLFKKHISSQAAFTFLTVEMKNPFGLGRIVRDKHDNTVSIIEEKDATYEQKQIKEINPACYIFSVRFLKKFLPRVKKSPITGEYYLTNLIDIAIKNKEKMGTVKGGAIPWRGINTKEELYEAERILLSLG